MLQRLTSPPHRPLMVSRAPSVPSATAELVIFDKRRTVRRRRTFQQTVTWSSAGPGFAVGGLRASYADRVESLVQRRTTHLGQTQSVPALMLACAHIELEIRLHSMLLHHR